MNEMNEFFAQYYNTLGGSEKTAGANDGPTQEDLVKQAQYEMFAKVAAQNGLNLAELSDAQVNELFERTMGGEKTASAQTPDLVSAAQRELQEKQAQAAQFQAADAFGRQAAHAYVDELKKVAAAAENMGKEASVADRLKNLKGSAGAALSSGKERAGKAWGAAKGKAEDAALRGAGHLNEHKNKYVAGAGIGAAAGAAAGAHHMMKKKKEASALDQLAGDRAVEIVEEYNKTAGAGAYDIDDAAGRIGAVLFSLGLPESEKVASVAGDVALAVEVRALEALEQAGYPVQWPT